MEKKSPEEILNEMNRIYLDREKRFNEWNQDHEKKKKQLESMLEQITAQRKEIDLESVRIKDAQEALEKREQDLLRRENEFSQLYAELETIRNETLELKIEAENSKFERVLQNADQEVPDLTQYILRSEHNSIVEELHQTIKTLKNERIHLLKSSLGMSEEDGGKAIDSMEMADEETDEEQKLTASVLKEYLDRISGVKAEIQMNDGAQEVVLKRNGIMYSFLFTLPPSFTLLTDMISQEQRNKISEKYPEIQMLTKEDKVHFTGYFTDDIAPRILIERVFDISSYLEE